ncbi:MAG: ABC transporter substrate-binding protein [Pseudonocardia sp.]
MFDFVVDVLGRSAPGRVPSSSRRYVLPLLAVVGLLIAGCSTAADAPTGPDTADRLTIATQEDRGPINLFAGVAEPLAELVYDKLVAPSPYVDEPKPWLATTVRAIDPSTWEVDLRQDITWHDGTPFGVEDVVFTFQYMKDAPTGRWTHHVSDIPTISSTTAVDVDTVRFTCAFACPELGTVTLADLPIIPKHIWSAVPPAEAKKVTTLPIGTGPYRLMSYDATSGYRFEANPAYFGGTPRVRELVVPVIEDPSATFTALRSGQIDATFRPLSPELIDQFAGTDGIQVIKTGAYRFPEMRMNFERAPFDNPDFRRAVSRAVDKDQMLAVVGLGKGRAAVEGYPHPDSPHTAMGLSTPYDATEANTLLDGLGLRDTDGDGVREGPAGPLNYQILVNGAFPTDVRAAELVAEDLGEVGIGATVAGVDAGTLSDRNAKREFDLQVGTITAHGVADPDQFIMSHRSGYLWKAPAIAYPEWDALFERWKATTTNEAREEVSHEMQMLFNRQPTSVPLYYPDEYYAVRPGSLTGWMESPGFGVVHKWSLLPAQVSRDANAVVAAR